MQNFYHDQTNQSIQSIKFNIELCASQYLSSITVDPKSAKLITLGQDGIVIFKDLHKNRLYHKKIIKGDIQSSIWERNEIWGATSSNSLFLFSINSQKIIFTLKSQSPILTCKFYKFN